MPKVTQPLTDTQVKSAKAKAKEYNLYDGGGLMLRVTPNGTKSWLFNYFRPYTKKRANIGLGKYPDVTLSKARTLRHDYQTLLADDIDPKHYKDKLNADAKTDQLITLVYVVNEWLKVKRSMVSNDHADDIWRSLELHIIPDLGKVPIKEIKATNTIEVLKPVANKGSLETVRRLSQRLNEIMDFAVNTGLRDSNPLSGIRKAFSSPKKSHLPTIKPEEFPTFLSDLRKANMSVVTRGLILWQLHTMVRPGEAVGTQWKEIDWDNKLWTVPANRMKKKRIHKVPLTKETIAILKQMKEISSEREHVFPSVKSPRTHANPSTPNMAIKRMGYHGKLVAHGLRSLASTILNEHGFEPDLIEVSLAHVDKNDVRGAYNRAEYVERRRHMMDWWSNYIHEALKGNSFTFQHKDINIDE